MKQFVLRNNLSHVSNGEQRSNASQVPDQISNISLQAVCTNWHASSVYTTVIVLVITNNTALSPMH